ncbi:MAB_1171c family putative transporter [Streptomyces sp. 8N706]|uniref:MAB_1171c family putative transporter n=1 Tax=Streptomyces sp. 8N706 TaxID=3457416 RepID=UPI003FD1678D
MNFYLHPLCAVIAWLALFYKISDVRRSSRDYALIALCSVLAFSALSFTLSHPLVWPRVDGLLGFPNSAALVSQCCVVMVVVSQQVVLVFWSHTSQRSAWRAARTRLLTAALVLAALISLFLSMSPAEQRPKDFTLHYADHPLYATYLLLYIVYYAFGEIEIGRLSHRYAKVSHRLWLRRGLRLIALGAFVTLGYSTIRIANLVAVPLSLDLRAWEPVAWFCGDIGALLTLIGWTLPGWGPFLGIPRRWMHTYLQYRRLLPLWKAVCAAAPAVRLTPHATGFWGGLSLGALEFRLYRQVIEIRDGQLALRDYTDPGTVREATRLGRDAGLADRALEAVVEAARLASMLRAARERDRPAAGPPPSRPVAGPEQADLADETAWLVEVARAFAGAPVVAALNAADSHRERVSGPAPRADGP